MTRARIGVIGAGQLGRMLALAGYPLGIECVLLDRDARSPGGQVANVQTAELDDAQALARLAGAVGVLTLEIENVPVEQLSAVAARTPVYPPPAAVAVAQDRLAEKRLFQSLGIPTAPFLPVDSEEDLARAARDLGLPLMLKARRMGYDGRGQRLARSVEDLRRGWRELGAVPAIVEAWVRFERELSLISVCGADGALAYYPLSENTHVDGILRSTLAPYPAPELQQLAEQWLGAIARHFDYRGVLTVEFFHADGQLIANEMAPRVHNSGHWTIEGAETSQFENHLRAVLGWPLGDPTPRGFAAMLNLIGSMPSAPAVLGLRGVHLHDYGKSPRAMRKLGHCTIVDSDRERLLARLSELEAAVGACGG